MVCSNGKQVNSGLQLLRFFASISIVIFHSIGWLHVYRGDEIYVDWYHVFSVGVDVFFIISGLVITMSLKNNQPSIVTFVTNRLVRIVPLYWLLNLLFLIVEKAGFVGADYYGQYDLIHYAVSFFFMSGLFHGNPVLYVGWSLEWEMLFYLIAAFSLALYRDGWDSRFWACAGVLFGVSISVLASSYYPFCFLCGCLLFFLLRRKFIIGVMFNFAAFGFSLFFLWLGWSVSKGFVLIGGVLLVYSSWHWLKNSRIADVLGDSSYAIYLLQVFAIPVTGKLSGVFGFAWYEFLFVSILATSACGVVVHIFVEKPMIRVLRSVSFGR